MIDEAKQEADTFKGNLKNSITDGELTYIGLLGELVCKSANWEFKGPSTFDYDVVLFGSTWDVKTKRRSVLPQIDYSVSVPDLNQRQSCDYYIFASIAEDKGVGHVVGYYPSDMYWRDSTIITRRSIDGSNGFQPKATTHNMHIADLYSPLEILPHDSVHAKSSVNKLGNPS
jgi:hypothetical protein